MTIVPSRREFVALIAGAMTGCPSLIWARAPADRIITIGVLAPPGYAAVEGLKEGFRELGYVENRNLVLEYRWTSGSADRFAEITSQLVRTHVDALVTFGTPAALGAQRATTTIPVVMAAIGDPVGSGLVSSLARPGRNITGFISTFPELDTKRLQLMTELVPHVARVGVLWNATNAPEVNSEMIVRRSAPTLQLAVDSVPVRTTDDLDGAFERLRRERPDGVLVLTDPMLLAESRRIIDFMAEHRLPAMYTHEDTAKAGGLVSYGAYYRELFRRSAAYVDRILNGAPPSELPVQQPERLHLVINLKTARALGLTVPDKLLALTDEVIE
jgi:putative tryptophan/tyrosine transport system substrate-binding protein